jgi:alkylated DNA repair dioxygenase AlkB
MRLLNRDGEIHYHDSFLTVPAANEWLSKLMRDLQWQEETLFIAGRSVRVPRLTAWYGHPEAKYRYSGRTHDPLAWNQALLTLKDHVEALCGSSFNSVLANFYRNGNDSIGWHADNERELGPRPRIASLSLGAERIFEIRHNLTREILRLPLHSGSLLIMSGDFQSCWQHRIPKQRAILAPRINLTFRHIVPLT